MISKELLSEVLKDNDILHFDFSEGDTILYYANDPIQQFLDTPYHKINIYELAHKCKEWAFDTSYLSIIVFKMNDDLYKCEIADIRDSIGVWSTKYSFKAESEQYAVFEACQWILDR